MIWVVYIRKVWKQWLIRWKGTEVRETISQVTMMLYKTLENIGELRMVSRHDKDVKVSETGISGNDNVEIQEIRGT